MSLIELITQEKKSAEPERCLAANILDMAFDMDWLPMDASEIGFEDLAKEIKSSEMLMYLEERIALSNE